MLTRAQSTCIPHLNYLYNMCFDVGKIPTIWKQDNRIYLPKSGRSDYHVEKAYRPLSLNSVTGKIYEHTMARRFTHYLYTQFCIDEYNFAYKKNSSTLHGLLYMINSIKEGFREDKVSAAIFIDLEGAFDAIWRDGLIYQVADIGVRGNVFLYIVDFLRGRQSRSIVNSYTSDWTTTHIGVPQGSIIAPILFVHYIKDITSTLPKNMKYADDVSAWVTNVNATLAAADLQNQLVGLSNWLSKWRLTASAHKTEVVLFCKRGPSQPIHVVFNGNLLKQVSVKRSLGMDLDHNLHFDHHTDLVATRAIGSIASLHNLLTETGGVRRELAVNLYKAFVMPHITYAYPVWSTATRTAHSKIERFQRIALIKATGCINSTPTNALISGCMPLNLRLREILAQEYVRIMRKPNGNLVKVSLQQSLEHPVTPGVPVPGHLLLASYRPTSRKVTVDKVEPEPSPLICFSSPITTRLITDKTLGSSTTGSQEQIRLARSVTSLHLDQLPTTTLIIFTDGSALSNPGPCGSSAIVYTHGLRMEPAILHRPVSQYSSSYHAELSAIDLALEYSSRFTKTQNHFNTVSIHTDCQSVIATLLHGTPNGYHSLVNRIHSNVKELKETGVEVELIWVAGHVGLAPNDLADHAAKEAAADARQDGNIEGDLLTFKEIKALIRKNTIDAWQRGWSLQDQGRFTHKLFSNVQTSLPKLSIPRKTDIKLNRLRSGHTLLPEHAAKMGLSRTGSPQCQCGMDTGTIAHFLLHCSLHAPAREALISKIELAYISTNTPPHLRTLDVTTLLGSNQHLTKSMRLCIQRAMADFLACCSIPL